MGQECVSRFSPLAAGPLSATHTRWHSPHTLTSPVKSRVWGCPRPPSGRLSLRARSGHRIATGWGACGYKTASGRRRWPNRDPLGIGGGINLYGFVGNDAVDRMDPDGRILFKMPDFSNDPNPKPDSYFCRVYMNALQNAQNNLQAAPNDVAIAARVAFYTAMVRRYCPGQKPPGGGGENQPSPVVVPPPLPVSRWPVPVLNLSPVNSPPWTATPGPVKLPAWFSWVVGGGLILLPWPGNPLYEGL
jgi:RHS repeat-associated protein